MAIAATAIVNTANRKVWDITCLAADTGPTNVAHGFGVAPAMVVFTPMVSAAAPPEWSIVWDATNITLTKLGSAGSGGGVPGTTVVLRITATRGHSMVG